MSFFDDLLQKITPGPGTEKFLSALPELFGAYESARGKPIGAPLQMLGKLGEEHAGYREQKGNANALQQLVQTFNPQNAPIAASMYKQFQPAMDQMTPEAKMTELQNLQNVGEREQLQPPLAGKDYYNPATNAVESYEPGQDRPAGVIPWGNYAAQLMAEKSGNVLKGKETDKQAALDVNSQAKYGMHFADLRQKNPQAADAVETEVARRNADFSLANRETMLPMQNAAQLQREQEYAASQPHDRMSRDVLRETGLTPAQYGALPGEEKDKIRKNVLANEAKEDALHTAATSEARAGVARSAYQQKWLDTPTMSKSFPYFTVDPRTFETKMGVHDTAASAEAKGLSFVPKTFEEAWSQSNTALGGLDEMLRAGKEVLPPSGSSIPYMNAKIEGQYLLGSKAASDYKSQTVNLIPVLRAMAKTSRPNQKEIDLAVKRLQNVANVGQLEASVEAVKTAVRKSMGSMMALGDASAKADRVSGAASAAISAMGGGDPTDTPDAGYSTELK